MGSAVVQRARAAGTAVAGGIDGGAVLLHPLGALGGYPAPAAPASRATSPIEHEPEPALLHPLRQRCDGRRGVLPAETTHPHDRGVAVDEERFGSHRPALNG